MTVRTSRRGDGTAVRALTHIALSGAQGPPNLKNLPDAADSGIEDMRPIGLTSRRNGRSQQSNALVTFRIADHQGDAAGMSYCGPPGHWITQATRLPMRHMISLTERLMEVQMLAVLPRYRGQSHGTDLLRDAIDRHRAAGYTALMVQIKDKSDARLLPWWVRHGFTFAPLGASFIVQFWRSRAFNALYNHVDDDYYLGMLPLTDTVTITPGTPTTGNMPTITGLLD